VLRIEAGLIGGFAVLVFGELLGDVNILLP